jgi:2-polyprenyl-3-methyl-5-hydroxy-6-metoxy-1,4-benzoquinol methylase
LSRFYRSLADYYDELFPLDKTTIAFVSSFLSEPGSHILDIGCATGQLALALASQAGTTAVGTPGIVGTVTAIEPDEKMVALVKQRADDEDLQIKLEVLPGSMLDLDTLFPQGTFHLILCLGNTLVHLQTLAEIRQFVRSVYKRLKKGGVFLLQIVNYTRILKQGITELPLIDKPRVSLTRNYRYDKSTHMIRFLTRLTLKDTSEIMDNDIPLYPLEHCQLLPLCSETGFETVTCSGSFKGEPWTQDSPALVIALRKPGEDKKRTQ